MSNIVSVTDFRNNIADVLNRVRYRGETVYLVRGKTLVAKLTKVDDYLPSRLLSKRQNSVAVGFLPAARIILSRKVNEGFVGLVAFLKQARKFVVSFSKLANFKIRRWVKFCLVFQKSWG